jgi:hypothetical protein
VRENPNPGPVSLRKLVHWSGWRRGHFFEGLVFVGLDFIDSRNR